MGSNASKRRWVERTVNASPRFSAGVENKTVNDILLGETIDSLAVYLENRGEQDVVVKAYAITFDTAEPPAEETPVVVELTDSVQADLTEVELVPSGFGRFTIYGQTAPIRLRFVAEDVDGVVLNSAPIFVRVEYSEA